MKLTNSLIIKYLTINVFLNFMLLTLSLFELIANFKNYKNSK